jgi:hypothetical protein
MADMPIGEHRMNGARELRLPDHWPLLLIAAPAAVAVWSGWVGLGGLCGFGEVNLLPGIGGGFHLNTAITLPIGVESYGAYALYAWLSSKSTATARTFARRSSLGALALGCLGQVVYHLLAAAHMSRAPAPVVVLVACLPVVTLSFAAALTHLLRADAKAEEQAAREATEKAASKAAAKAAAKTSRGAITGAVPVPAEVPQTGPTEVPSEGPVEVPAAVPAREPRQRAMRISKDPLAEKARAEYRKSVRQGQPLTDRALAEKFKRSRTWGATRIREAEAGPRPVGKEAAA